MLDDRSPSFVPDRPFAARELIIRRDVGPARDRTFVIDPWTQRWLVLAAGAERVLQLADGERTVEQIAAVAADQDAELLGDPSVVRALVDELVDQRLIFLQASERREIGLPVYNKSSIIGLHLEVTNACNLRCRHCYVESGDPLPNELSDDELRAVVDELAPFSGKTIAISGGEPAVRKGCMDLVAHCAIDRGHHVDLYTNGYKFPRKFAQRLVEFSEQAPSHIRLQVSLEGARAATNDLIRGRGSFDQTIKSLEMFRELGLNRQTRLFVCVTKLNVDEIDALIALAERLEVGYLNFSQWQRQGNASDTPWESIAPTTKEWVAAGERLLDYRGDVQVSGNFFGDLKNVDGGGFTLEQALFPKHLYFYNAVPRISPDGMIFADQFWTHPDWSLGNVRDMTMAEAFDTPKFYEQLEAMRARVQNVPECSACEWRGLCESGSPGHTHAEYGDLDHKDLFCDARKYWFERFADAQIEATLSS
jgi:radical SAM protein with 4Fe4S-binding SPASM domain